MRCSLIIPVRNSEATLGACLTSAMSQTLDRSDYEILVVDDGSEDRTAEIAHSFEGVRVLKQAPLGPAEARNLGAREALAKVVVFVDSDCEIATGFLKVLIAPIEAGKAIGVQGGYKTRQLAFMAQFSQVEIETRYAKMAREPYVDFIGTYGAAYSRDVFLENGGFDGTFAMASGEDVDLSFRLHRRGYRMLFEPRAIVYHQHPATLRRYLKVKFYRGYWRVRLYRRHPGKVLRDSYTPLALKLEVLLVLSALISAALALVHEEFLIPGGLLLMLFFPVSVPFVSALLARGRSRWFVVPGVLLCRASALLLGMVAGLLSGLLFRSTRRVAKPA